jgi:hypothetical protein
MQLLHASRPGSRAPRESECLGCCWGKGSVEAAANAFLAPLPARKYLPPGWARPSRGDQFLRLARRWLSGLSASLRAGGTPHVSASKQVKLQFFTLSPADKNCRGTAQARMTHSAVIGRLALGCEWTLLRAGQVVRGACNSMTLRRRAFFSRFYNSWVRRSPTQESNAR